jgi:lipoprotein-releasing system ATP-binding protein
MSELIVENVTKEYPTRAEPLVVLRGVSLSLPAGAALAIVGPSGCGKSTLLHILGTLEPPTSGSVRVGEVDPFQLAEPELAAFRNRQIGFVFQDHHLLPQCSALENVLLPSIAQGRAAPGAKDRARELLRRVGLERRLDHRPTELSGGERQRAAVARALISKPALLLADEPTGNLDRSGALAIAELLLELQAQERTTLIVVTHSMEIAARIGQRHVLDDGRLTDAEPQFR